MEEYMKETGKKEKEETLHNSINYINLRWKKNPPRSGANLPVNVTLFL